MANEKEGVSDFVGAPNPNPTGFPILPAEGLAFPLPLPPNPPNPPNLGGELPKGEFVEGVPKGLGLEDVEAPKGLEDGAEKTNADEADGALEPKIFVGSEGLGGALSLGLEVDGPEGNENAGMFVLGGKENEDDFAAVASSFGVNPPPNGGVTVDDEEEAGAASLGPNPDKEAGGVGIEKELTLAVETDKNELVFLVS